MTHRKIVVDNDSWIERHSLMQSAKRQRTNATAARYRTRYASPWHPPMALSRRKPVVSSRSLSLERQIRGLIASKRRDAADKQSVNTDSDAATTVDCLTSSTVYATAASGTGLLDCDADEVLINSITVRGQIKNNCVTDVDPTGNRDVLMRKLYVWFYKPLTIASAAGTLPPVTEVLVEDEVWSLPVQKNANGGRFKILFDRTWNLGTNTVADATGGATCRYGRTQQIISYTIKVGMKCKFKAPSQSGTAPGGHYDSDVSAGQIDSGLLVCYTLTTPGTGQTSVMEEINTRLNYTA